ncbi:MAG: GIY-YIG nuclease family protein [Acidobacteriia bacterium]|nr:GIY-YIG nuclease family protein [Terriglobia bacterium]
MHFVYILESLKDGYYYIGSTHDVAHRLEQHNAGRQAATRYRRPFELVYVESYSDPAAARRREHFIKKQKSRLFIEALIHCPRADRP